MAAKHPTDSSKSTTKETEEATTSLTDDVPPPLSFEKSKLDWLLAINEQYFEAELWTVVSYHYYYYHGKLRNLLHLYF